MKNIYPLLVVLSFFFCDCAAYKPPVKGKISGDRLYAKSFDAIWTNLIDWFARNNIPIKTLDKSSGLIATEYNLRNSIIQSCDCGVSGTRDGYAVKVTDKVVGNFNVLVRKLDDGTIKVNVSSFFKTEVVKSSYTGTPPSSVSMEDCESTGYLENQILESVGK